MNIKPYKKHNKNSSKSRSRSRSKNRSRSSSSENIINSAYSFKKHNSINLLTYSLV